MKGAFVSKSGVEIRDFDIIQPEADQVLIKNVAVASNPKDWKMAHLEYGKESKGMTSLDM